MNTTSNNEGLNSTWEAIVERSRIFEQAMAKGDAHAVSECYTIAVSILALPAIKV